MNNTITVKGSWLNACGKGTADRTFSIIEVLPTMARNGSGFEVMYKVDCDGIAWTVAKCRTVE